MLLRLRWCLVSFSLAACVLGAAMSHAQSTATAEDHPDSRIDIYGGYGYFHPINSGVGGKQYQDVYNPNATVSVTYYFNHFFGAQVEGGYFSGNNEHLPYYNGMGCNASCDQLVYTAEAGPVLRYPLGSWIPFIHVLGGGERTNGPAQQPLKWGWGVTGGFGVDYVLPFYKRIAIRPIQADFQYSQVVYGPLQLPAGVKGGFGEIDALKLSGGIVLRFGSKTEKRPVVMECSTDPAAVYPGDPVNVTGSTADLDARKKTTFTWATTGGKITPSGPTATIDTTGLAPGDYKVSGHVQQGMKASEQAGCDAPFTVKPYEPPVISCAAVPASGVSGTTISIAATASSPQNRPLTYSYATTAGQITGTGPTATLSTAGLSAQDVKVTCNVVDDRDHSATATADVTITVPPVPVVTQTQQLCSLSFDRDRRRPVRVDNESKACLDDIALTMDQDTGAKLETVGNASPDENPVAAAQRALNVRQYLTQEKGIDPGRIEVRVGDTSGRTVNNTLVPPGAIFNDANTELFDEKAIPRTGEAYGVPRARRGYEHHAAHHTVVRRHRRRHPDAPASPAATSSNTPQAPAPPPPGGSTLSQLPQQ
jgi:hypothetical protein